MTYVGVLKRFLPFVAAFAAGVFLASFFVSVTPRPFRNAGEGRHHRGKCSQMRAENERLQAEIEQLKEEMNVPHTHDFAPNAHSHWNVAPAPPAPPAAPATR